MNTLDIQQAIASGQAQLGIEAYSRYLKYQYGLSEYCGSSKTRCLLLFLWAIGGWDNRPGAVNPYTQTQLNNLLTALQ